MHSKNAGLFAHELTQTGSTFGHGVSVSIGGDRAYTDHETIVVPGFDTDAEVSTETARAMRGYIDNEAAHIRHTPKTLMKRAYKEGGMPLKQMVNAIEDLRIERETFKEFPGAKKNIEQTLRQTASEAIESLGQRGSDMRDVGYGLTLLGRLRAGYDAPEAQQAYDLLADEVKEACEAYVDKAMRCKTPAAVTKLSRSIIEATWPGDDEGDDDGGNGGGEADTNEDEQQAEGQAGDEGEQDDTPPTESQEQEDGDGGEQDGDGSPAAASNERAEEDGDWVPMEAMKPPAIKGEGGYNPDRRHDGHYKFETQDDVQRLPAGHHWRKALNNVRNSWNNGPYRTRSDWGVIKAELRAMVGPMLGKVQAALSTETEASWQGGYTSGRLDSRRLVQAVAGHEAVWRRKTGGVDLDTAVLLLVDCSGSMAGRCIKLAQQAAVTLSMVCERASVPNAVVGFDSFCTPITRNWRQWFNANRGNRAPAMTYEFKGFDTPTEKAWYGLSSINGLATTENADADALIAAEAVLRRRAERRKVLIVLSDGAPASCGDPNLWQATKDQAARLDADPAFDVFGIGIGDDAVRDFYREHVVLRDINELPREVTSRLCQSLIGRSPIKAAA